MLTRSAAARAARLARRHPQAAEAFASSLKSALRQWTALELAVFHQWGGDDSGELASKLVEEILYLFDTEESVYKDDVSLLLEDYLETNFSTICEDESPDELGQLIVTLYKQSGEGNFDLVNEIIAREARRKGVVAQSVGVDQGDAVMESDEEEGSDAGADGDAEEQFKEAVREEIPKLIDEEGFELVSKKGKKAAGRR